VPPGRATATLRGKGFLTIYRYRKIPPLVWVCALIRGGCSLLGGSPDLDQACHRLHALAPPLGSATSFVLCHLLCALIFPSSLSFIFPRVFHTYLILFGPEGRRTRSPVGPAWMGRRFPCVGRSQIT